MNRKTVLVIIIGIVLFVVFASIYRRAQSVEYKERRIKQQMHQDIDGNGESILGPIPESDDPKDTRPWLE